MKYLIYLGHPAHYHLFSVIIKELEANGHNVRVLIKTKDILEDLCREASLSYDNILPKGRKNTILSLILSFLKKYRAVYRVIRRFKPDLLIGSEVTLAHLGKLLNIPSVIFAEDDAKIIPQFALLAYPFVSAILSPNTCSAGRWENKKIGYNGFQKLAYLHPNRFHPIEKNALFPEGAPERYFILRFSGLDAYHDANKSGITTGVAREIVKMLKPHGRIFISSERPLEKEFINYRLNINPLSIHHYLYHADLFIGDSQSMAVEASILGTSAIRFNDFAGKIGVLEELENKYELACSFSTKETALLYKKIKELLNIPDLKDSWRRKQQRMLSEKIDVAPFYVWFVQNYPKSAEIMRTNPDYQLGFK